MFKKVDVGAVARLVCKPTIGEAKIAVWDCGSTKAPGPDGFSFAFIKHHWASIFSEIMEFLGYFFDKKSIPRGCNASFITLIPKIANPCLISDYRPISLISVQYKIIAKLLANRLALVIDSLVDPIQSAFVGGRQILDGLLLLNEVLSWSSKKKKKMMLFKVDFAKAYDSLNWCYLLSVLRMMGFGEDWCDLIQACLASASSSVLINGSPTKEFVVKRGLRQGDPLSPFLFILAMEGLHAIINREVQLGNYKPVLVGRDKVPISHLFYADDVIFVGEWSCNNLEVITRILNEFFEGSGLKLNNAKSNLFGVGVGVNEVSHFARPYGFKVGMLPFTYLGVPVGDRMNSVKAWDPIIEKFRSRLSKWKANLLSMGGRMTLISSVLGSLPNYFLSIFRLPKRVCAILEGIRARFFWGANDIERKIHWVKWDSLLVDKDRGGLGIGSIDALNRALLLKWKWRFLSTTNLVWARIVSSIHGGGTGTALDADRGNGVWNRICHNNSDLHNRNIIPANSFTRHVGRGDNTRFWDDIWIGDDSLSNRFPRLYALENNKLCKVSDRIVGGIRIWNWRRDLRGGIEESQFGVLRSVLEAHVSRLGNDVWKWDLEGSNDFEVRHVRKNIEKKVLPGSISKTRWNKAIPKKVNVFMWRLLLDRLPTRSKLCERGIPVASLGCVFCNESLETSLHLFGTCKIIKSLWRRVCVWLGLDAPVEGSPKYLLDWLDGSGLNRKRKTLVEGIVGVMWWVLWKSRNDIVHRRDDLSPNSLFDSVVYFSCFFMSARDKNLSMSSSRWLENPILYV